MWIRHLVDMEVPRAAGQPVDLAGQLLFRWETPSPTPSPVQTSVIAPPSPEGPTKPSSSRLASVRKSANRNRLKVALERFLHERKVPFVDVQQAAQSLPRGTRNVSLSLFHFVVYRDQSLNWLVLAGKLTARRRQDMEQWERLFGEGFVAVTAKQGQDQSLQFNNLQGEPVTL